MAVTESVWACHPDVEGDGCAPSLSDRPDSPTAIDRGRGDLMSLIVATIRILDLKSMPKCINQSIRLHLGPGLPARTVAALRLGGNDPIALISPECFIGTGVEE